jgi:hypothetical protein
MTFIDREYYRCIWERVTEAAEEAALPEMQQRFVELARQCAELAAIDAIASRYDLPRKSGCPRAFPGRGGAANASMAMQVPRANAIRLAAELTAPLLAADPEWPR